MSTTISTTSKNFFLSIKKSLFDNGIFYSYSAENERYTLNILGLTPQESKELLHKFFKPYRCSSCIRSNSIVSVTNVTG